MSGVLILLLNFILSLSALICEEPRQNITTVKGHTTILYCDLDSESLKFIWTKDNHTLEQSPRIKMQDHLLWLLNTTSTDSGLYACRRQDSAFSMQSQMFLSIEAGPCPNTHDVKLTQEGKNINLSCSEDQIPVLGQRLQVQWRKDCEPTGIQGDTFSLFNVSTSSKGNYTCMVMFRYEDRSYIASHNFQLTVLKKDHVEKPRVIDPHNRTLYIQPGAEISFECRVFIGFGEETGSETSVYWLINEVFIEQYPELQQNLTKYMRENSRLYATLTLHIPKVLPKFFGIPFRCVVLNPNGEDTGEVWLSQGEDHVEKPRVIDHHNRTLYIQPGAEISFECRVFIGVGEETGSETSVYWLINEVFIEQYPDLQQNLTKETRENSRLYATLTLYIPKVLPKYVGIPFRCVVLNPSGVDTGEVWLSQGEDNNTDLTWPIIVALLVLAAVLGAVLLNIFRIDLILAYRHLCGKDKTSEDGMLFNAYVLNLYGKGPGSSRAEDLALRIFPEVLEHQYNLKLFIQGRDTDAEVGIANITDVLSQSKAVVLILPGNNEEENLIPLSQGQSRLEDAQLPVLFSGIAHSGVPVLLVESEENADYSLLPESIQSLIKKKRVLKWKSTVQPNGRFWKQLRYHMT